MKGIDKSVDQDMYLYRGIVVDNNDPLKLGRVRVRVASLYGLDTESIPDSDIPWAFLVSLGASYDAGAFIVPEVGSTVVVGFENGNHETPLVFGGLYSMGRQLGLTQSTSSTSYSNSGVSRTGEEQKPGRKVPAFSHDVPKEGRDDISSRILYRSPKGSSIVFHDSDGLESIAISDPNGQGLELISPMTSTATQDDKHKYVTDKKSNLMSSAKVLLHTAFGQILKMVADGVNAVLNFADSTKKIGVEVNSTSNYVRVFNQSANKAEIFITDNSTILRTTQAEVAISGGAVSIRASSISLEAPTISINGTKINLSGTTNVSGALNGNGTDLLTHTHMAPHGMTGGPQGGSGSGGSASAPSIDIPDWRVGE